MIYFFDLLGTFVFAISGALAASRKQMDIFGFSVLALLPAIGGGTLRDLLIGRRPIFWVDEPIYVAVAISAAIITYFGARWINSRLTVLRWMDAVGLALFAVLGCRIALGFDVHPIVAMIMGTITAVTGGMLRDVVANEVPLILSREIYATAAFAGSASYILALKLGVSPDGSMFIGFVLGLLVRSAGLAKDWSLPAYHQRPPKDSNRETE